tara:strand:+ start:888 stop:1292 length:405 start_codon:yes stop_codon:yes gene_type:complete
MTFKIAPFPGQTYSGPYADHSDVRAYLGFADLVERKLRSYNAGENLYYDECYTTLKARKLPIDFCTTTDVWVPLLDHSAAFARLYCKQGLEAPAGERRWRSKSSAHRCYAVCPDCGVHVPAGRAHQHKCKGGAA